MALRRTNIQMTDRGVTANDTVTVEFRNFTGAGIAVTTGRLRADVMRHNYGGTRW